MRVEMCVCWQSPHPNHKLKVSRLFFFFYQFVLSIIYSSIIFQPISSSGSHFYLCSFLVPQSSVVSVSKCTYSFTAIGKVWCCLTVSCRFPVDVIYGLEIHIHLITATRKATPKKASQDNIGLGGFALTASIYWSPLCGRFSGGCLSRVAFDGMCHSVFDSMCICVRCLWTYRFATQNDVYLYQVRRYEAKVLVWGLSKSFQWVFMCACAVVWFIRWNPPS